MKNEDTHYTLNKYIDVPNVPEEFIGKSSEKEDFHPDTIFKFVYYLKNGKHLTANTIADTMFTCVENLKKECKEEKLSIFKYVSARIETISHKLDNREIVDKKEFIELIDNLVVATSYNYVVKNKSIPVLGIISPSNLN